MHGFPPYLFIYKIHIYIFQVPTNIAPLQLL